MLKKKKNFTLKKNDSYYRGYNLTLGGDGTLGYKHTTEHKEYMKTCMLGKNKGTKARLGKKHSEETKHKISLSNKGLSRGKGKIRTKEHSLNISLSKKGVHLVKKRRTYEITHPDGKLEIINGLKLWCEKNNLSAGNMCSLNKGTLKYYKGYKCRKLN